MTSLIRICCLIIVLLLFIGCSDNSEQAPEKMVEVIPSATENASANAEDPMTTAAATGISSEVVVEEEDRTETTAATSGINSEEVVVEDEGTKEDLPDAEYLKVCADGYMLPFSNKKEEGYENKIAQLFAKKLGLKLKYEFFPQRMGFIRNTLRAESEESVGYKCDLVISVPSSFELAATTDPYYRSTWVLVFAKGRGLDEVTEPQMLAKVVKDNELDIKIGLPDRGSPAQLWVFYQELMGYMVPYQGQPGDIKVSPGHTLIKDIVDGKIDTAIIWGPTAGYYADIYKDRAELVLLPVKDDTKKNREMKFSYSISMAVRYGEKAWKEKINNLIKENKTEIEKILTDYGVPLVK